MSTLKNIWNWIKGNPIALAVVIGLALFVAGYSTGRYAVPAKVVVTEKVHEVTVEKQVVVVQTKTEIQVVKVHDATKEQKIHRVVAETTNKDGSTTKTTTEDINVDSVVHDHDQTNSTEVRYVDKIVEKWQDKIVEKTTTKLAQPDWSVYAGVGISIPHFIGQGDLGVPGMQGLVVQAGVDRRILGPFWLGIFGNTQGVVGANLRFTF